MHVTGTKHKFTPLIKGMVQKSVLFFFSVSYICPSLDRWMQGCPNGCMLCGPPKLCLKDNLQRACQVVPICAPNYSVCLDLKTLEKNIRSRRSIEILPSQILQSTEKPTPAPCLSVPSQPATTIIQLWATTDPIRAAQLLICL